MSVDTPLADLTLPVERDDFLRALLRHLTGTLQEVVGLDNASGFVSVVGQKMGEEVEQTYCQALQVQQLERTQVAAVMVDFKRRIQGEFSILSQSDEKIVLRNQRCPFAEKVLDRPALCMMTSNIFGTIAAENLGYAKVVLDKTIAQGDAECLITIYLQETSDCMDLEGQEYFKSES